MAVNPLPVIYTCVTSAYDSVEPAPESITCDFILLHDGTVNVPAGWQGVVLSEPGLSGADLNRYAKMLPHKVFPDRSLSLYIDGNFAFKHDPSPFIRITLERHDFAAFSHPDRSCPYEELRRLLTLGFINPISAAREVAMLRRLGIPRNIPLFEAGVLLRRDTPTTRDLCERWWRWWQQGIKRDQPSLAAINWLMGGIVHSLGKNDVHSGTNRWLRIRKHSRQRSRLERLPNRLASELMMYRLWT